jgi:glyoxylase-like metal-dependent hydrolase (beta-lactamase superfamily II)
MKRVALLVLVFLATTALLAQQPTRSALVADRGLKPADFPLLRKLADNVFVFSDLHTLGYMTNDLIVLTPDGVLVADGQGSAAVTQKLVDHIKTLTSQPIKYVIVASDHGDHTGGNASFPSTATFIASPFSKGVLERQAAADRPNGPKTIVPSETVADKRILKMGGTEIQILYSGKAHTGGDLEVYLPKEKIAFMSEVWSNHIFPSMRTAWPTEWISTLKNVAKIDANIIVPGHGFIEDPKVMKDEFAQFSKALEYVVAEATRLHKTGVTVEEALKQANWGPYEQWTSKDRNAAIAMQRVYDELDGKLK